VVFARSKRKNNQVLFYECDFTQPQKIFNTVNLAISDLGEIHAGIHTAVSPILRKRAMEITPQDLQESFSVDLFGGMVFLQSIGRHMITQGFGKLLAITTRAIEDQVLPSRMSGYLISKFALKGLLKILHQELFKSNIAVSALAPGFMDTPLNSDLPPRLIELIKEQSQGGLILPEQVGEAVYKILSMNIQESSGKTFFIDSEAETIKLTSRGF
jgi:NAD(P)-dependent dehydrogenase (short-subunit alcohol dehydrogenase family)